MYLSFCVSISISISMYLCPSVSLPLCLFVSLSLSFCISLYISVSLSLCVSISIYIYLYIPVSLSLCGSVSPSPSLPPSHLLSLSSYSLPTTHLISQIAAGLFNAMVRTHLLLIMNKASAEYEDSVQRYRKAAKLFQGQVSRERSAPQEDGAGEKKNCMTLRI